MTITDRMPDHITQLLGPREINQALADGKHVFTPVPEKKCAQSIKHLVNDSICWVILSSGEKYCTGVNGCFFWVDDEEKGPPVQTSLF
jgi:hypothetical protein